MRNLVVDLGALRQNVRTLTAAMGDVPIYGVCKATALHGTCPFAQTLLEEGIETLAVASIDDAAALRQAGISCDILMLSSTSLPAEVQRILELDLIASLGSVSAVELLEEAAARAGARCAPTSSSTPALAASDSSRGRRCCAPGAVRRAPH